MKIDKDEKRRIYETEMIRLKARRDFEKEGGGGKWVWLIVVVVLLAGSLLLVHRMLRPSRLMRDVERIIASAEGHSGQQVGVIWDQFEELLRTQDDPAALASLVGDLREAAGKIEAPIEGFRAECYWIAETGALLQLGELGTDEAAAALVALLCEEKLSWDRQKDAMNIAQAITICGKACLPLLEKIPADHPRRSFADHLIPYLQRGEIVE